MRNFLIYILAVIILVCVGMARRHPEFFAVAAPEGSVLALLPPPFAGQERLRLVLIGADDREDRGRSDTLMLLEINPRTRRAVLFSIPRDLRVYIPGHRVNKINHAYHYGGVPLTRQTVEHLFGFPTDGYVKINLEGFVKAVDILGGVYLEVEDVEGQGRGMNYDCPQDGLVIHLKPGYQHLNGYKAMGYVRYRLSNIPGKGSTDFERAKRQQKFLRALLAQKLRVSKLPDLYKAGREILNCVDTNLSWRQLIDLGRLLRELEPGALKTETLPARDQRRHGVYYCALDEEAYQQMRSEAESFLAQEAEAATGKIRVEVLNGSGIPGAAARTAKKLESYGYIIVNIGNAEHAHYKQTVILYRGDKRKEAERLAQLIGARIVREDYGAGEAPPGTAHVQITLGRDVAQE